MSGDPKRLEDGWSRRVARRIRDRQWADLEQIAGAVPAAWCCFWDKRGRHRGADRRPEETGVLVFGLVDGVQFLSWAKGHGFIECGEWSEAKYAQAVTVTDAGRAALADRSAFDMEPVEGGLVEPGWVAVPAERAR